jgi:hypothetical protein
LRKVQEDSYAEDDEERVTKIKKRMEKQKENIQKVQKMQEKLLQQIE